MARRIAQAQLFCGAANPGRSPAFSRPSKRRAGFTLLEVMVATLIMAIAVAGLLSNITGSLRNAARVTDYDRATLMAKRKMDELLSQNTLPLGVPLEGLFDNGGWKAQVRPYEVPLNAQPGMGYLQQIQLEIWWQSGGKRRNLALEAFRRASVKPEDVTAGHPLTGVASQ